MWYHSGEQVMFKVLIATKTLCANWFTFNLDYFIERTYSSCSSHRLGSLSAKLPICAISADHIQSGSGRIRPIGSKSSCPESGGRKL